MTVKTAEDREFLYSLFLETGSSDVLDMLEGGSRGVRSTVSALKAKLFGAAPVLVGIAALMLYR